jgi:hypothetical protein
MYSSSFNPNPTYSYGIIPRSPKYRDVPKVFGQQGKLIPYVLNPFEQVKSSNKQLPTYNIVLPKVSPSFVPNVVPEIDPKYPPKYQHPTSPQFSHVLPTSPVISIPSPNVGITPSFQQNTIPSSQSRQIKYRNSDY